jgi:hypothetical protein
MADVFNDANYSRLFNASKIVELPQFVKEAAAVEEQDFSNVPSDQFAYPSLRRYPHNSKSNTYLSRLYFDMDKTAYDKGRTALMQKSIDKAARFWGLEPQLQKTAAETEAGKVYSIPLEVGGQVVHTVEIESQQHFKEAVEYLYKNKTDFNYDLRRQFARGLYRAPKELVGKIQPEHIEYMEKAAGFGMNTRDNVGKVLLGRVCLLEGRYPEYSEKLTKYAMELPSKITPAVLHKTASIIDLADRAAELHRMYGQGLQTPEEALFAVTEKTAAEVAAEMIPLQDGNVTSYTKLKLNKSAVDKFFQEYFGEIPYSDETGMRDVVASLPRNDAEAFTGITQLIY